MPIEVDTNNPLGLTVAGPGYGNPSAILYPGQIGDETSGLGYTFAQFPTQQSGIAAGIAYIAGKIQSGAVSTVGGLVDLFSPNDQSAFTATTGLPASAPVSASNAPLYAAGIAAGEGTLSAFGGASAFEGSAATTSPSTGNPILDAMQQAAGAVVNPIAAAGNAAGPLAGAAGGSAQLQAWLTGISGSVVFVVVGVVILLGVLYMLAVDQGVAPPPSEVVAGAAVAAG